MKLGVNGRFLGAPAGGVRRFAERIARGVLAEAGGVLFVPADVEPGPFARARSEESPDGRESGLAPPPGVELRRGRLRGHAWEQIELPGAARRAGCDVVLHLANSVPLRGGPHVATAHDVTPLTHPEWFRSGYVAWHRWVVRPALRRAAALLTVSDWSVGEVRRVLELPVQRLHRVAQGPAPLDGPAAPDAVRAVRRRYGLTGPYALAVGGRDPRKNLVFLVEVLDRLGDGPRAPALAVVGSRHRGRVWAAPPELDGGGRVVRVGEVDDETLRALYTGTDALCHPALAEGFGRPPLEALACGAPAVVAPYGPAREVLGDAAEVVPLDADAWAATLERVRAESGSRRARRVERGRRRAARHRWEDGVRRTLEVCRAVAGGGRRSGEGRVAGDETSGAAETAGDGRWEGEGHP